MEPDQDPVYQAANPASTFAAHDTTKTIIRIDDRLKRLGLDLPEATTPKGAYANVRTVQGLAYVSGHGPFRDGSPAFVGKVPTEVSLEEANQAARLTMLNCLSSLQKHLGDLERIRSIVKILGMVNAEPDFAQHPAVIDGASDVLIEIFGHRGSHTRSAFGVGSLPFRIPIEIEMIVQLDS